ncbi:MAG: hypothetical protein M3Y71_15890 [Actinomycetota bacterium]|nr:hypothetical protein [Actinomycetota bacterium]
MTQWSTPEHVAAAAETIAASIDGWHEPAIFAVGMSSATSDGGYDFPVVNHAGEHTLAALVVAKTIGYAQGSLTHSLSATELRHALTALEPAETVVGVAHPNLTAWRLMLFEHETNPARTLVAVFVGDLGYTVTSDAEAALRTQLPA